MGADDVGTFRVEGDGAARPRRARDEGALASLVPPLWDVVEEHLDEAEFLWAQREGDLDAPDMTLDEVADIDEDRLLANVEGLVIAGAPARERLLWPALEDDAEPNRMAAAALALLSGDDPRAARDVIALLASGTDAQRAAAMRAAAIAGRSDLDDALAPVLAARDPAARAAALDVLSFRGDRRAAEWASDVRAADDPRLVAAALRALRGASARADDPLLAQSLISDDPAIREAAMITGLVRGVRAAFRLCRRALESAEASPTALACLAIAGDARDHQALAALLGAPESRAAALWAIGFGGRVAGAEACLPLLHDDAAAPLAAEAFIAITGMPVDLGDLLEEAIVEPVEPIPFEEEDLDADLVPGPEARLPRIDPARAEAWWAEHQHRFDRRRRYLAGEPISAGGVLAALARGPMRRRHVLALELAIRTGGSARLETRALAARQRAELAALGLLADVDFERPLSP